MNLNNMNNLIAKNFRAKISDNMVSFVRFKKIDGSVRNMICTVNLGMIPKDKHPLNKVEYTDDVIRVFDIVAQGWRSMRIDNIMEVTEYGAEISQKIA